MTYRGLSVNEYGTEVSLHTCDTCGEDFSVCPAVPEEHLKDWNGCQADWCGSYQMDRDPDMIEFLGEGIIV